ncbi:MAG: BON domain-containing protein [Legionellaceae bacterium]|nr:BON domain-containing protein [Legionellaceae bacterium]
MLKKIKLGMLAVIVLTISACGSTSVRESTGQYLDSMAVTTKVKARLVDALGSKALAIKVKTYKDEVQLSGFVNSNNIKNQAGIIADNTVGVESVRNDLIVKSRM